MKIMLDVNVLIDYLQKREPHYHSSSLAIKTVLQEAAIGFVPAHGLTTVYYILAKHTDRHKANQEVDWLLQRFEVAPADKTAFINARRSGIGDFEDAVVAALAESSGCDYIVTRNMPDFEHSPIPAITPEEFVNTYVMRPNNMSRRGR